MVLRIDKTWDGQPVGAGEAAEVTLLAAGDRLRLVVEAPFHADPPPMAPPGPTDALWNHEVVEVFLLGRDEAYLEVELGPHGHHLVLQLRGARKVASSRLPLEYEARIDGLRWSGAASLPRAWLPACVDRANAYAIHGTGESRRFLAAFPVPGGAPDFHRLACFGAFHLEPE